MKKYLISAFLLLLPAVCLLSSCKDEQTGGDPASLATPTVRYAYDDKVTADLNKADNLPIVGVVNSEAGLKSVVMKIETSAGTIDYKTVTSFFNPNAYSLAERLTYQDDYKAFLVTATDRFDRETSGRLAFDIIELKEPPRVVFNPTSVSYDETVGGQMPETGFVATSRAELRTIDLYVIRGSAQERYTDQIVLPAGTQSYNFAEVVPYQDGDRGFKVVVEDSYGQVSIETMPVSYKAVPPPVITLNATSVTAAKDETKAVGFSVTSESGISAIKIFRMEGANPIEAVSLTKAGEKSLTVSENVTFTNATTGLRIEATDRVGKTTRATMTAIVNMRFISNMPVVSHLYPNGIAAYPDTYPLISVKDLKTYSVDYALANATQSANVDIKFYCFSSAEARLYTIYGASATATKNSEFASSTAGVNLASAPVQNNTMLIRDNAFDFDNATAVTIAAKAAASINAAQINTIASGDVIFFKTASTSSAGGNVIGVLKFNRIVQVTSGRLYAEVSIKVPIE